MNRAVLAAFALALLACDSGSGDDNVEVPKLTMEELQNPESCKECHPKHYEHWSGSMHAYAGVDPVFLAMNKRGQEETNGQLGKFCVNCHAPMALQQPNPITDFANLEALPSHMKGVTCYFCHNAIGVGDKHVNGDVKLAHDDVMRANVRNPVEPTAHKVASSPFHDAQTDESSRLCGTCHDIETPKGVRLERTYEEYLGSVFGSSENSIFYKACNDCHMPRLDLRQQIATKTGRTGGQVLARDFHEHLWPAVDIALTDFPHADAMRSAVSSCVLPNVMSAYITIEREEGPLGQLNVLMEQDAGHNFPSGATQDRRVWLELIARNENQEELYRIGQVADQQIEETEENPHPCILREYIVDENGKETHDFWEAATIKDSKLMPVAAKGTDPTMVRHTYMKCTNIRPPLQFAEIAPAFIDMRLRMRPMGMDVLTDLVSTGHLSAEFLPKMPTFTVFSRRATFDPVTRSYRVAPQNDDPTLGDCKSYLCMLDPNGPECVKP